MENINKNDLLDLLNYALDEYGDPRHMSAELMKNGRTSMAFGTLTAEVSKVEVKKNTLYLRLYNVKDTKGKCFSFILGHSAVLFSNSAKEYREQLISDKCVKGVITLKREVFKQITIPAAIIMLGEKVSETWFTAVDSIDCLLEVFCGDFSTLKRVYYSGNISAHSLNPEYYNGDDKIVEKALKRFQTTTLENIAEVIAGKAAKSELYSETGISYLRGRDLQNGKILKPELFVNTEYAPQFANCLLQEGDILLTKNFGQNKLAIVTEEDLPAIASNGLIIIRAFGVSENYLYKYLTSKTGSEFFNKQLLRIQKGGTIPSISISDLKTLLVPVLDDSVIKEIESDAYLTKESVINASKQLLRNIMPENDMEMTVFKDLISAGWKEGSIKKRCDTIRDEKDYVTIKENAGMIPDLSYRLDDGRYIFFEIKVDLQHFSTEWIEKMKSILSGSKYSFLIITTGTYYEVHKSGVNASLKLLKAPTIQDILDWEKEVL